MTFDEAAACALNEVLGPLDFAPGSGRRWIRTTKSPIREIFRLQPLKGATYSCVWGFDLEFVPVFTRAWLNVTSTSAPDSSALTM